MYNAIRSADCSASDFGTISPSTMWKYVRIATATTLAAPCAASHSTQNARPIAESANAWSSASARTCSPYMPSPRLATEIPICVVAM
jgi:hypothetical protein